MIRVDKNGVPCHCQYIKFSYTNHWFRVTWCNGRRFYFECDELVRTGVDLMQAQPTHDQWRDAYKAAEQYAEQNIYEVYGPEVEAPETVLH